MVAEKFVGKGLLTAFAVGAAAVAGGARTAGAAPMIDRAHDRVQTTLRPGLERIGTLTPRSAREIGPSRLAIGCEMLPRGYGDFEAFKEYLPPLGLARVRLHACYARGVDEWVRLVRREAPSLRVWNGESGATSQAHYSAPISSGDWNSELTQCKWNARRLVADLGHGIESLVFTMYDPCYDAPERYSNYGRKIPGYWVRPRKDRFMKWMGLVKCDETLQVTKVKPAYYTVQNVATLFDATVETANLGVKNVGDTLNGATALYGFRQTKAGTPLVAFWDASDVPSNENVVREVRLQIPKKVGFKEPVWIDLVTGAIYAVPKSCRSPARHAPDAETWTLPMYDAPAVLTERALVMP